MRNYLPDPADGGEPSGNQPTSAAAVKNPPKNPPKSPREVGLEKKLAVVEDKVNGLEGWQSEINSFLADLGLGSSRSAPAPKPGQAAQAPAKGVLDSLHDDIFGEG